jgi:hypothetical protein
VHIQQVRIDEDIRMDLIQGMTRNLKLGHFILDHPAKTADPRVLELKKHFEARLEKDNFPK